MCPTYEYSCGACGGKFDVIKRIADLDREEVCTACGLVAERRMPSRLGGFIGASDWNRQEYNPGLGCETRGWRHAEKIAKERGLEPVGTISSDSLHRDAERRQEDRRKALWDDKLTVDDAKSLADSA